MFVTTLLLFIAAQTKEPPQEEKPKTPGETIVITASKIEQPIEKVPGSIGLVDKKQIEDTSTVGLHEVLDRIPGVVTQNAFGSDDVRLSIRGAGIRSNFGVRGIVVTLDGIPITESDGQTRLDIIDLATVRRIEVVRGPASTIYGGNATGGVVNLITLEPDPGFHSDTRTLFGSFGFQKYYTGVYGGTEDTWYSVCGSYTTKDGYRDHSDHSGQRYHLSLRFKPDADSEMKWLVGVSSVDIKMPGPLTKAQMDADPTQARAANIANDWSRFDDRVRIGTMYSRTLSADLEISAMAFVDYRTLDHPIFQYLEIDRLEAGGDVRALLKLPIGSHKNNLIAGISYQAQVADEQDYVNVGGSRGALTADKDATVSNFGVYMQDEFSILDNLLFTAGVRWSRVRFALEDHFLGDGDQSDSMTFTELSTRAGLAFIPSKGITIFANVSTAFETPTLTELTSGAAGGFVDLVPMKVLSYEIGVRGDLTVEGRPLGFEVALFRMDFEDEIIPTTVGFVTTFSNAARTVHQGFEVALGVELVQGLRIDVAYAYSDFRFTGGPFDGKDLPGIAPHQLFGSIEYAFGKADESGRWRAALEVRWSDSLFVNDANTVRNASYTTLNLKLSYQYRSVTGFFEVANLTDEQYVAFPQINGSFGQFFNPADARAFIGGVSFKF